MSLETEDIIIIVAAVVVTMLLVLCCVNICYFFWLRKDNRFASFHRDFHNDFRNNKDLDHHHKESRSGGFEYDLTPDNHYESRVEYKDEGQPATRYHRVIQT